MITLAELQGKDLTPKSSVSEKEGIPKQRRANPVTKFEQANGNFYITVQNQVVIEVNGQLQIGWPQGEPVSDKIRKRKASNKEIMASWAGQLIKEFT